MLGLKVPSPQRNLSHKLRSSARELDCRIGPSCRYRKGWIIILSFSIVPCSSRHLFFKTFNLLVPTLYQFTMHGTSCRYRRGWIIILSFYYALCFFNTSRHLLFIIDVSPQIVPTLYQFTMHYFNNAAFS